MHFLLIIISIFIFSCSSDKSNVLDNLSLDYRTVKYYSKENQVEPLKLTDLNSSSQYFKVFTIQSTKKRTKEEFYKRGRLMWYKTFSYNDDDSIRNTISYNRLNNKIRELLLKDKKIVFRTEYIYASDDKTLIEIQRFKDNKIKSGWWVTFDKTRKPIKRVFYDNGKIKESFINSKNSKNSKNLKNTKNSN